MRFINAGFHTIHNLLVCVVEETLSVRSALIQGMAGHIGMGVLRSESKTSVHCLDDEHFF